MALKLKYAREVLERKLEYLKTAYKKQPEHKFFPQEIGAIKTALFCMDICVSYYIASRTNLGEPLLTDQRVDAWEAEEEQLIALAKKPQHGIGHA